MASHTRLVKKVKTWWNSVIDPHQICQIWYDSCINVLPNFDLNAFENVTDVQLGDSEYTAKNTVYTRVQVERVYKSNPIFEAKNTTFLEKVWFFSFH